MNENAWKILIVDDEPEIHTITKLVMSHETILGRKIEFLSAMNGDEARMILSEDKDIALVLLDVVMKTNNDGLGVAKWIREGLNNKLVRIVLRTGNPGDAPEMKVITGYEINDYKEKSELTSNKLRTLIYTSLRNYRDLAVLDRNRRGLERIVSSLADLFVYSSLEDLLAGVLEQISSHLFWDKSTVYGTNSELSAFLGIKNNDFHIIATTGEFEGKGTKVLNEILPANLQDLTLDNIPVQDQELENGIYIRCIETSNRGVAVLVLSGVDKLSDDDKVLLDFFINNASMAVRSIADREESDTVNV